MNDCCGHCYREILTEASLGYTPPTDYYENVCTCPREESGPDCPCPENEHDICTCPDEPTLLWEVLVDSRRPEFSQEEWDEDRVSCLELEDHFEMVNTDVFNEVADWLGVYAQELNRV